ncbi:MAG: ureidoglycolate lyase [Thalassobaculaceae bacterium]|nr:ureidoglycolate lyase [Thalassobaculaceae bacterium]
MTVLTPIPLTADAFAPFGHVLSLPTGPGRVDYSSFSQNLRGSAAEVCFRTGMTQPSAVPLVTRTMERHEFSSQAFLPVDVARYLVLVAPHGADGLPDPEQLTLFLAKGDQGISYNANVWHHPMTVLDRPAIFATVMFLDGGDKDEEFVDLPHEVSVTLGKMRMPRVITKPEPL